MTLSERFNSSLINGIQVISEEWDCGLSADDILSYYREQMTARGWEDTTKQTYGFQPENGNASLDDRTRTSNSLISIAGWWIQL